MCKTVKDIYVDEMRGVVETQWNKLQLEQQTVTITAYVARML